jgi:lipooligosaccharide transport system ATP-binding protein
LESDEVTTSTVLSFVNVTKSYSDRTVLSNLNLSLDQGECIALLGPNGAGKSTTISLALGLSESDSGSVELNGYSLPVSGCIARKYVGVVPQYDALDPDFTVLENLLVFGRYFGIHGQILRSRAEILLEFAQLKSRFNHSVISLSGGMRRRLMLARALINEPSILFLDEPTTGLDPRARQQIWDRLLELKKQGVSIFLTTHYMDEAQRLADRVAVLDRGKLILCDTPSHLINQIVGYAVLELWGTGVSCFINKWAQSDDMKFEQRGELYFFLNQCADHMLLVLKNSCPSDVEYIYRPGNLEDVFFSLTGKGLQDD